jgi:CRP/FNR family transcriptional activator FtrB
MPLDHKLSRGVPLLDGLDPSCLERLLSHGEVRTYPKGRILFDEGDMPDCLFVILSGMVELYSSNGKRDAAMLILWAPETFMPAAALFEEPYLLSARTLTPARLLTLQADQVRKETASSPELSRRFTQILGGQFRMTVRHIKDLKLRSGPKRVAAFLLRLVDETGKRGFADLPIPKGRLASRLGLTPESLSRALHTLSDHGLAMRGSRVILSDRDRLVRFCKPDPLIDGRELSLGVTAI